MSRIFTKDNSPKDFSLPEYERDLNNLRIVANKSISELQKENSGILIFPPRAAGSTDNTEDKIANSVIFHLTESRNHFTLKTGNIMGFIGRNDTELNIFSRFSNYEEGENPASEKHDFFLHYMLEKVCHVNLSDLKTSATRENIFDFLPFLFPQYLTAALKQGLYKEYRTKEYNDSNLRGVIDVNRHIRFNIPANGKIAYRTREYSFDNPVTQLVRHTIEYMRTNPIFRQILNRDDEIKDAVAKIDNATSSYNRMAQNKILSKTSKPIKSPYFSRYRDLQKICRMILLKEKIKYYTSENKIYGILFDGAWLWEEYIWTILKNQGFVHPQNKKGSGVIHPFSDCTVGNFYPDFYLPKKSTDSAQKASFVIDTKYKNFDENNPLAVDLHQMISYVHVLDAECGKFLYPSVNEAEAGKEQMCTEWTLKKFGGKEARLGTIPYLIPQKSENYELFCKSMHQSEEELNINLHGLK